MSQNRDCRDLEVGNTRTKSSTLKEVKKQVNQYKFWCFTIFKKNRDQFSLFEALKKISVKYIFQLEKCPTTGSLHYQGCFTAKKKMRITEVKKHLGEGHYEKSESIAVETYCAKKESRVEGPWEWPYKYRGEDIINDQQLYTWQKDVLTIIKKKADTRKIYWFWENEGNVGKSSLAKYICWHLNGVLVGGARKDIGYAITQIEPVPEPIYIFDIPRCQMNHVSYAGIEQLKNGLFFNGKYESGMYMGPIPHILIFANNPPDMTKLSEDRYKIICLNKKNLVV